MHYLEHIPVIPDICYGLRPCLISCSRLARNASAESNGGTALSFPLFLPDVDIACASSAAKGSNGGGAGGGEEAGGGGVEPSSGGIEKTWDSSSTWGGRCGPGDGEDDGCGRCCGVEDEAFDDSGFFFLRFASSSLRLSSSSLFRFSNARLFFGPASTVPAGAVMPSTSPG